MRVQRFSAVQRLFHFGLVLTFFALAMTGVARMYHDTSFGQLLTERLGGDAMTLAIHKAAGLIMLGLFVLHCALMLAGRRIILSGPDSLLPQWSDFSSFFRHTGWIFGLCEKPSFDRWTWWEKLDYWAVFWGVAIIGTTGVMLYSPEATARYVPGWWLNVAQFVHGKEALLALGYICLIHFPVVNLRPHAFPLDMAMIEGSADMAALAHEKPAWVARLRQQDMGAVPGARAPLWARLTAIVLGWSLALLGLWTLVGIARFGV